MPTFQQPSKEQQHVYLEDTDQPLPEKLNPHTRYLMLSTIAKGGKSLIKSCKDRHLNRVIAYKELRKEFQNDEVENTRLLREARVSAMLQHPNIAQVLEFDQVGDELYIAMELVEGLDLRGMLSRSKRYRLPIPTQLTLFIVTKILKGLSYAHEFSDAQGPLEIVHRDISPHNILLSRRGEVKVTDFGIARLRHSTFVETKHLNAGTVAYMSPEIMQVS